MGLRLMCVAGAAGVALLLLLTAAILRLCVLLIELVTLRYSLAICALTLSCWFVDSRRQRYAKGFYSCSRVPQTQPEDEAKQGQEEETPVAATVAPVMPEALPAQPTKVATAPPSETESEDDESEAGGSPSVKAPPASHSKSFADVRTRSNTTDGELQRRQATRPRSSSAVGDSRSSRGAARDSRSSRVAARGADQRSGKEDVERKRRMPRRRADTGMAAANKHNERSRRATFASKQDAYAAPSRSNSEMLEDALRSDGYWIGDFRVQRRLVPRRSYASSPKGN
ncbi:hypothetical protein PRIC1_011902 [Phytophthora ramorum]